MKTTTEEKYSTRIKRLRGSRTQEEFADVVGVYQPAVSAMERGAQEPTPEIYIRLGNLAAYPDNFWFWRKGGLDIRYAQATSYAEFQKNSSLVAPGEMVHIPRMSVTEDGLKDAGKPLAMPTELIPNPFSAICIGIDKEFAGQLCSSGDMVIVDTARVGDDLSSLIGQMVLLELPPLDQRKNNFAGSWPKARFVTGILAVKKYGYHYLDFLFVATVGEHTVGTFAYKPAPGVVLDTGMGQRFADGIKPSEIMNEAIRQSDAGVRLFEGCRIFGSVLGWFKQGPKSK